jgi:hypothetical protein
MFVRFEVFTEMSMKKVVFWDLAPCGCGWNHNYMAPDPRRRLSSINMLQTPYALM